MARKKLCYAKQEKKQTNKKNEVFFLYFFSKLTHK